MKENMDIIRERRGNDWIRKEIAPKDTWIIYFFQGPTAGKIVIVSTDATLIFVFFIRRKPTPLMKALKMKIPNRPCTSTRCNHFVIFGVIFAEAKTAHGGHGRHDAISWPQV